jgi:hypothetical protein
MNRFEEIKKLQKELKAKILAIGKDGINDFFKPVFDANPSIEKIRWKQYTPYFNDGDACVFNVYDATVQLIGGDETGGDCDDGFLDEYHFNLNYADTNEEKKKIAALNVTWDFKLPDEDILQQIFGDHTEVTVNRDGTIEQEDYEHD